MTFRQFRTIVSRSVWRRQRLEADLDDEIRFHLAQEAELQASAGAGTAGARQRALQLFGSTALAKESARAVWGWTTLEQILQDLRFGCRILTRSPGLSLAAIVLVALVVGGNTTIFTMVHGVLKKPAAGVHTERLTTFVWSRDDGETTPFTSHINYREFVAATTTFESVLAFQGERLAMRHANGAFAVSAGLVSPNYFDTLGVRMVKGRTFNGNQRESSGLVAVVSYRAWQTLLGGGEDVVGNALVLNGHAATIIGVAEPQFRGALLAGTSDVWVPLVEYSRAAGDSASMDDVEVQRVSMLGRLKPGATMAQAKSEASTLLRPVHSRDRGGDQLAKVSLLPYSATADGNTLISRIGDRLLALLTVVSLLTLVVVCANVANLLVARGVVRRRETALRQSLGASRLRVVRMLLAEGAVIAAIAGVVSFLVAWWVARLTTGFVTPSTQGETIILPDFTPDWPVAAYAVALAAVAVVAFTLLPAVRVWRSTLQSTLRIGELSVLGGRSRLSTGLVVLQLALCVLLLVSAGIAYRSMARLADDDRDLDTNNRLLVTVNTSASVDDDEQNARLLEQMQTRLAAIPGVDHVAFASAAPLNGWRDVQAKTQFTGSGVQVFNNLVSPMFLEAVGVPLLAGGGFSREMNRQSPPAAIVNQTLANTFWPGANPIGRTFRLGGDERDLEVVGLVPDLRYSNTRREIAPKYVFLSNSRAPFPRGNATFVVLCSTTTDEVAPLVRRALVEVSDRTPIVFLRSMRGQRDALEWPQRFITRLLMLFAVASLLIATIGQYAAALFDTRRRLQEFGLRMALGASARQVLLSVLREGSTIAAVGLAIGFAVSVVVAGVMKGLLVGVTTSDPIVYVGIFALLAGTSLLACYLPARRATLVDPAITLRHE